jgi:peptidoglycan LD-endopeptidase LytH
MNLTPPELPPYDSALYGPVVDLAGPLELFDFAAGYDPAVIDAARWGIGRYDERRSRDMYCSHLYADGRCIHMGLDIWGPTGTPVFAVRDGCVYAMADNDNPRDYGPTIVTEHEVRKVRFWLLHGHLSRASLASLEVGDRIERGQTIGYFGPPGENGGWAPHLHLQVSLLPPRGADMPGVVHPDRRAASRLLYPDPRKIVGPVY